MPDTEVAAAVLMRGDEFLLACRPEGKVYAGFWEFPGGKVEPGETVRQALVRELREELGIGVITATPWLTRRHVYPHARVRVHFWRVTEWRGEIGEFSPLEHSAVAWQPKRKAATVAPILPANAPVLKALSLPVRMAITHAETAGSDAELRRLSLALAVGDCCIQVRDRGLPPEARHRFAAATIALAREFGAPVVISEAGDGAGLALARAVGADGIHLTASALAATRQRPDFAWVGASCHEAAELAAAETLNLDYALLGPVLPTASHPDAPGLGWPEFARRLADPGLPVFALGGQRFASLSIAMASGAHGIALLSGLPAPADLGELPDARTEFALLLARHHADPVLAARLVAELVACYSAPGRHYHTLIHLADMLRTLALVADRFADPEAARFALFYHDIVYDPERSDNEEKSAEFAAERLGQLGLSSERIARVMRLILATVTHAATGDADSDRFIDLDLAALAAPPECYRRMVAHIREEYHHCPAARWRQGRRQRLASLLALPALFKTAEFQVRYEQAARANIQDEIASLDAGEDTGWRAGNDRENRR